ncbi:MAG: fibronectin type III domain-containing protein [Saprospiraceae bacterium]|nr:fibronectin type III domain-containing protein [Saprospiraceae bacterium]
MKKTSLILLLLCCTLWSYGQISTFPYTYDFENETNSGNPTCGTPYTMVEAGWLNEPVTDMIDWSCDVGTTGSGGTGPTNDHTLGTPGGHYMYIEATNPCNPNNEAILYTPQFSFDNEPAPALSFWYHMFGGNMGDLSVDYTLYINGTPAGTWLSLPINSASPAGTIPNSITDNVNAWQYASIDLAAEGIDNTLSATVGLPVTVQFRFRGVTGPGFTSDMAIDDFAIFDNSCPAPTGLTTANVTGTSVDVSWTGTAAQYQVEAVPSGGTPTGTGPFATLVATNAYTITGLNSNTGYDIYVRAVCGADTSIWTGPEAIATACGTFTAPYIESFDLANTTPNCWTDDIPAGGEDWFYTVTGPNYGAQGVQDHTGNGGVFAWIDGSTNNPANNPIGVSELLISPIIDISGLTNPALRFYAFSNNVDNPGDNNTLTVNVIDIGNGGAVTNILTNQADLGPDWYEFIFDLSTFVGPVQVEFGVETNAVTAFYNDILLDDIEFYDGPSCYAPSAINASNITDVSADLSWLSSASQWSIEIVPAGTATTGTGIIIGSNPFNLTGLSPNTAYDVYIAGICAPGDTSDFAGPYTFITACGTFAGDDANTPIVVNSTSYLYNGTTANCFTNQYGQNSADAWFMVVLDACATDITASLCNSSFDTYIHLLDVNQNSLTFNDDGCGAQSQIQSFPVTGGDTVFVVVEGFGTSVGAFELEIDQNAPTPVADFFYNNTIYCQSGTDPSPVINASTGGVFSEATTNMTVDPTTGIIDLDASASGTYVVKYTVTQGVCVDEDSMMVIVDPADDASFAYAGTSFCAGDANSTPIITGLSNGVFSETSGNLALNTSTGEIDIVNSMAGNYTVTYTTAGLCPNTATVAIDISNPSFNYSGDPYCTDNTSLMPMPDTVGMNTTAGGTFSTTGGLVLDGVTGMINVATSTPGTYTITYAVNGCTLTDDVVIAERDDASFAYAQSIFCSNDLFPLPTITGTPGGAFSSPTSLTVNIGNGQIDLLSAPTGISHTVIYATNGACPSFSSTTVYVEPADDASFAYDASTYCIADSSLQTTIPNITGLAGGTFSATGGLNPNTSTGEIDLLNATAGVYDISYSTNGTCPNTVTVTLDLQDCTASTSSLTVESMANYSLFPNPNRGQFVVVNEGESQQTNIEVLDLLGRSIYTQELFMVNGASHQIDLGNDLAAGTYFVRISNQNKFTTIKVSITE